LNKQHPEKNEEENIEKSNGVKIATCHTCHWAIYQGDLIYYSSTGNYSGTTNRLGIFREYGNTTLHGEGNLHSGNVYVDQWVQCQWCIDKWKKELEKLKKWKRKWGFIIWLLIPFLSLVVLLIFIKEYKKIISIFGLLLVLIIDSIIWSIIKKIFAPKPNRYKLRNRPKINKF
jgi:hypothetical protein